MSSALLTFPYLASPSFLTYSFFLFDQILPAIMRSNQILPEYEFL